MIQDGKIISHEPQRTMAIWFSHFGRANPGPERWKNGRASGELVGHASAAHP